MTTADDTPEQPLFLSANTVTKQIQEATKEDRERILQELLQRAQATQAADDWNAFALGCMAAEEFTDAQEVFKQLVEAYPNEDVYRLNLATAYTQTGQFELAVTHLNHLIQYGSRVEIREQGRQQLEGLERFLHRSEQERQLRQLQIAALHERIALPQASDEDYRKLGSIIFQEIQQGAKTFSFQQMTELLEAGQQRFPTSVPLLELLILCYLQYDPVNRLDETLRKLEEIAPDSPMLQQIKSIDLNDASVVRQRELRSDALLQQVVETQDQELRQAALEDLRSIAIQFPANPVYSLNLAQALCMLGQCEEALQLAERVEPKIGESHNGHFNLGQIFWLCGNAQKGRQHLELAEQFAQNERERQDICERIKYLEQVVK